MGYRTDSKPDDPVDVAWNSVLSDWSDEEAHRRFRALCATLDRLPDAGKRYKEVRDKEPARRDDAERHIDALLALAMTSLELIRTPPEGGSNRKKLVFVLALVVALGLVLGTLQAWLG